MALSPEDVLLVQKGLVNPLRSFVAQLGKLGIEGQALSAAWNGGLSTVIASMDPGELLPNDTSYDGAQALSEADITNMVGYLIDLSNPANNTGGGGYNTAFHQALYIKAAGINATITQ